MRRTRSRAVRDIDPLKNKPTVDWRSVAFMGAVAGIVAGIVATAAELAMWWAASEPLPATLYRDAHLAAAIVLGRHALSPPATFDVSIMLVVTLVHFVLSIAYGVVLSAMISRLGTRPSLLVGAVSGLVLFALNMYGFTAVFPWFEAVRDWITAVTHVVFGVVAAATYKIGSRSHPPRRASARTRTRA